MVPRKGQYVNKEMPLLRQHFQVPISMPKDFFGVIVKKGEERFGVMAQQLRALIALPEDPI